MSSLKLNEKPAVSKEPVPMSPFLGLRSFFSPTPFSSFMKNFPEEMNRMMMPFGNPQSEGFWSPVVDVQRTNGTLMFKAELPGMKKEEVRVEVDGNNLIIAGERKHEMKTETEETYRLERSYGQFWRSFPLPDGAKTDQIKAELTDGVLTLSVPVPEIRSKVKQIPIEQGTSTKAATGK